MDSSNSPPLDWMMWQIESSQADDPPLQNLIRAIQYYAEKYGKVPNCCEVSDTWGQELIPPEGMILTRSKNVQDNTILLTVDPGNIASTLG